MPGGNGGACGFRGFTLELRGLAWGCGCRGGPFGFADRTDVSLDCKKLLYSTTL